jgi:hypothetical protein
MRSRFSRVVLVALVILAGVGAAYLAWTGERRIEALEERRAALERVLDRITPAVAAVAGAQSAYVDYGLKDEATLIRVGEIVDRLSTDTALLRSSDPSGEGAARLEEFWTALSALTTARTQARDLLALGDTLTAADRLLSTPRTHVVSMATALRAFRAAELDGLRVERAAATKRSWFVLAAVALVWLVGLLALVPVPRQPTASAAEAPPVQPEATPTVDLAATADLCVQIQRLTDAAALPAILERAAGLLDAHGIIIWMAAGEELFAVTAFGYDPAVIARLPPISRTAENATAIAWRSATLRTVAAYESSLGAVVAPMFGPERCIGVFAAEVKNGRERDAATRDVTAILAAQLAGVLAAWPAGSTMAAGAAVEGSREPSGSDRQSAAS